MQNPNPIQPPPPPPKLSGVVLTAVLLLTCPTALAMALTQTLKPGANGFPNPNPTIDDLDQNLNGFDTADALAKIRTVLHDTRLTELFNSLLQNDGDGSASFNAANAVHQRVLNFALNSTVSQQLRWNGEPCPSGNEVVSLIDAITEAPGW